MGTEQVYVKVTYLDTGYGRLIVSLKDKDGKWIKADKFTNTTLSSSGNWVTSCQRWQGTASNPPEIRVSLERSKEPVISIAELSVETKPFPDPHFQYVLQEPWKKPYAGPPSSGIDNSTLKGKVMAGYQGWFRTPNDPYDSGWIHWGAIDRGFFSVDMWPDVSGIPAEALEKAADLKTLSGKPATLFSSGWPEVTRLHFNWMRKHNIDGVFLQRFLNSNTFANSGRPEWVLGNVREAAIREGRIWAIEYDVSGTPDAKLLEFIKKDWMWLVDQFGLLKDPSYAHENGKPVVIVWGMPVQGRNITPETANAVVDFLKNDPVYGGNYVAGGLPGNWRKLSSPWQEHFQKLDGALAWLSKSYAEDVADFGKMKVDYFPHVWPGFSWSNLKHIPRGSTEAYTPRAAGQFYQDLLTKTIESGADRLFVGMLDEYDEGTAILPMSDDPPTTVQRAGVSAKFSQNATPSWEGKSVSANPLQINMPLNDTPPAKDVQPTGFTVRLEGNLVVPTSGSYTFSVEGAPGDGAVLSVGTQKVKVEAFGKGAKNSVTLQLEPERPVVYRLDYRHETASGTAQLLWESPDIPREVVPVSAFVDAWGRFITNEGRPSDWWLQLTGKWKESYQLRQRR